MLWANSIVFALTRSVLEPTLYYTRDEHANNYTTDVEHFSILVCMNINIFLSKN